MGVAWVGFAEASLLTTWTHPTTPGAHHGHPGATLKSQTTLGLTLPSPAVLPFMVAGQVGGPAPPFCPLPTPWAPSEAGQEPPHPPGPISRLPSHPPLFHPPPLQSLHLRLVALSSRPGKINSAA